MTRKNPPARPSAKMQREKRQSELLLPPQPARATGIATLIKQVQNIIADAGNDFTDDFDARAWVLKWIEEPLPALGNRTPSELMDTEEGQQLVSRTLAQSVAGAFV